MTASLNHDMKMDRCYLHLQKGKNKIGDLELAIWRFVALVSILQSFLGIARLTRILVYK